MEAAPDRRQIALDPVLNEVRESLGLSADTAITWVSHLERNLTVDADPDQLFRILLNLARNAMQALEQRAADEVTVSQIRIADAVFLRA